MPDPSSLTGPTPDAWADAVAPGTVLAFRFPVEDDRAREHDRWLPCLVLDVVEDAGLRTALLAPSAPPWGQRPAYAIDIRTARELARAGLSRPTRFIGAMRLRVSLANSRFAAAREGGTPILGALTGQALTQMNGVRGRIHAEADIAAEHRRHRIGATREEDRAAGDPAPTTCRTANSRRSA